MMNGCENDKQRASPLRTQGAHFHGDDEQEEQNLCRMIEIEISPTIAPLATFREGYLYISNSGPL